MPNTIMEDYCMEIREYEYQGEKGILLKDRDTMTNVFLNNKELYELIVFLFENEVIEQYHPFDIRI